MCGVATSFLTCVFLIKWWHEDWNQWRNLHLHSMQCQITLSLRNVELCMCWCEAYKHTFAHCPHFDFYWFLIKLVIIAIKRSYMASQDLAMEPCAPPQKYGLKRLTKWTETHHLLWMWLLWRGSFHRYSCFIVSRLAHVTLKCNFWQFQKWMKICCLFVNNVSIENVSILHCKRVLLV